MAIAYSATDCVCLQRLLSLEHVQAEMNAKDQRVAELEKQLEETQLLLQYSKKAFSKELTKNKVFC